MANAYAILAKLNRNLQILGVATSFNGTTVTATASNVTVTYVPAQIQSPMGGVDDTVSPYLGIGIAAPGVLQLKGAAGQNSLAAIFTAQDVMQLFSELCGFANDKVIQAGDTTTQLAYIQGVPDLKMMGE